MNVTAVETLEPGLYLCNPRRLPDGTASADAVFEHTGVEFRSINNDWEPRPGDVFVRLVPEHHVIDRDDAALEAAVRPAAIDTLTPLERVDIATALRADADTRPNEHWAEHLRALAARVEAAS